MTGTVAGVEVLDKRKEQIERQLSKYIIAYSQDTIDTGVLEIGMSPILRKAVSDVRSFLFAEVYDPISMMDDSLSAKEAVRLLFDYFARNEEKIPEEYGIHAKSSERRAVDYIAGMTDPFALQIAAEISTKGDIVT